MSTRKRRPDRERRALRRTLLASAVGASALLALATWSLVEAASASRSRVTVAARREALLVARALRDRLGEPDVFDEVAAARRFEVLDGRVVVPPELGALEPIPPHETAARAHLQAVLTLRTVDAGPGAWSDALWRRVDALEARDPQAAAWLRLRAAWRWIRTTSPDGAPARPPEPVQWALSRSCRILHTGPGPDADRDGGPEVRPDRAAGDGPMSGPTIPDADLPGHLLASAVAFGAAARAAGVPGAPAADASRAAAVAAAPRLGPAGLSAFAQRMHERGVVDDPDLLLVIGAEARERRRVLRGARRALPTLGGASGRVLSRVVEAPGGPTLLLWHGTAEPSESLAGSGALVEPGPFLAELTRRLAPEAVEGLPAAGDFVVRTDAVPADDAVPVLADGSVALVPPAPAVPAFGLLQLALLGAVVVAGVATVVSLRALHQHAEATRVRGEFLTGVTHELKTPLASIRLLSERLQAGAVRDERRRGEYHDLLAGEAARLSMLIENVLDLGRMERGERGYDRRPVRPDEVVRDAVAVFEPLARAANLELEVSVEPGPTVVLDPGALQQALLNLLDNARKYAAPGRVRVDASTWSGPGASGGAYRIAVEDRGPGIPPAERERVFGQFVRGSAQGDGSVAGVGLGLHLARRLVEDLGGRLACVPPAHDGGGSGARFEIVLATTVHGADAPVPVRDTEIGA